ncbi:MAG: hypothetical protein WCO09_03450 [bacterium]
MIKKILEKLGIRRQKPWEKYSFGEFFRYATEKEKKQLFSEVMRKSSLRQLKIIEEADKILAERAKKA